MPEITPEQREAAIAEILHRLVMTASRAMSPGKDADGTAMVVIGAERRALSEILALGWRAPGPPTGEEVEMEAMAAYAYEFPGESWACLHHSCREIFRESARAVLTAASGGKTGAD